MRRRDVALLGLLLAATFAAYLPALDGDFLLDDLDVLRDPRVVDPLASASAWLRSPRPVVAATFALNHAAVGLDTRGWHLTNVLVHLAAVVLAWLFARAALARSGLARPDLPALAAAGLFALHPLQTESVAYLTQRAEALASGLALLALWLLLVRDGAAGPLRRAALLAGAAAAQALGLLAKPIAATVPAAWLLAAALLPPSGEEADPAWRRVARRLPAAAPLLLLSAVAAWAGIAGAQGAVHAGFAVPNLSPAAYAATELRAVPVYLRLALWPAGQCADWSFPPSAGLAEPAVAAGAALLLALAGGALALARRFRSRGGDGPAAARSAAFGLLLFLLALTPSSSVIPLLDPFAEHRVYLGLLGLAVAAAAIGAAAVRAVAPRRALLAGAAVSVTALAALGAATAARAAVWQDALSLWGDAAAKAPAKARVHLNLGQALFDRARQADALAEFRRARDLRGDHTVAGDVLLTDLVTALLALGRVDEARAELSVALGAFPDEPTALALLAQVEYVSSRDRECEAAALRALRSDPRSGLAWKYLGMVRLRAGDVAGARDALRRAGATHLVDPVVHWELGDAERALGNAAAACAAYGVAATQPGNAWVSARAREAAAAMGCGGR
jgi:tetratricopeptide (TPR) repeat protein